MCYMIEDIKKDNNDKENIFVFKKYFYEGYNFLNKITVNNALILIELMFKLLKKCE